MYIKKGSVYWSIFYFILSIQGEKISCKYATINCSALNTCKYVFEVKLTFEMLTLRGQQHSFSVHERVFLWKCQNFWDKKSLDLRGTRTPNLRIHAECSNHWSYQGQIFAVPCFLILAQIFWSVNCACTRTYILDGTRHTERIQTYLKKELLLEVPIDNFRQDPSSLGCILTIKHTWTKPGLSDIESISFR